MFTVTAYELKDNSAELVKEINLDNKFKADKCWLGLSEKYPVTFLKEEDGSVLMHTSNQEFANFYTMKILENLKAEVEKHSNFQFCDY